jgi:hypothetical protein
MLRRKKKDDEPTDTPAAPEQAEGAQSEASAEPVIEAAAATEPATAAAAPAESNTVAASGDSKATTSKRRGTECSVGTVSSDNAGGGRASTTGAAPEAPRTCAHRKFMAHDELGATTGDRVYSETHAAKKRWRVVEIVVKGQVAAIQMMTSLEVADTRARRVEMIMGTAARPAPLPVSAIVKVTVKQRPGRHD